MINLKKVTIACILGLGISAMGSGILPNDYLLIPIAQASDTYTTHGYTIDTSSVWYDHDNEIFGAGVTDPDGNYFTATYKMVKVSSSPYQIDVYESKNNGPWVQIGVINNEASYQIGNKKTGGFLFRTIADLAARTVGYEKMF